MVLAAEAMMMLSIFQLRKYGVTIFSQLNSKTQGAHHSASKKKAPLYPHHKRDVALSTQLFQGRVWFQSTIVLLPKGLPYHLLGGSHPYVFHARDPWVVQLYFDTIISGMAMVWY